MIERYSIKKDFADIANLRGLAMTASFTTLVFLATSIFYLALTSEGFFNLGEAFIYVAALVGGPIVGMISGGVGAALADIVLGYAIFAPATFVLKSAEGFFVGMLFMLLRKFSKKIQITFVLIISTLMITASALLFNNKIEGGLSLFGLGGLEFTFTFPGYIILIISLLLIALIWISTLVWGEKGKMIISCISGGLIIVIGYFLYEWLLFGIGAALVEIPFNFGQVVFGTAIAIPIVSYLYKIGFLSYEDEEEK